MSHFIRMVEEESPNRISDGSYVSITVLLKQLRSPVSTSPFQMQHATYKRMNCIRQPFGQGKASDHKLVSWCFEPSQLVLWAQSTGDLSPVSWWFEPSQLVIWAQSAGDLSPVSWWFEPSHLMIWAQSAGDLSPVNCNLSPIHLVLWAQSAGDLSPFNWCFEPNQPHRVTEITRGGNSEIACLKTSASFSL